MRGKCPGQAFRLEALGGASMRPAHYAREVRVLAQARRDGCAASMRPAHYAREVLTRMRARYKTEIASMRPAHYAREVPQPYTVNPKPSKLQ